MKHYQPLQGRNPCILVFTQKLHGQGANHRLVIKWLARVLFPHGRESDGFLSANAQWSAGINHW